MKQWRTWNIFLFYCEGYNKDTEKLWKLRQPYEEDKKQIIASLLFDIYNKRGRKYHV